VTERGCLSREKRYATLKEGLGQGGKKRGQVLFAQMGGRFVPLHEGNTGALPDSVKGKRTLLKISLVKKGRS